MQLNTKEREFVMYYDKSIWSINFKSFLNKGRHIKTH